MLGIWSDPHLQDNATELRFLDNGEFVGNNGCNSIFGSWRLSPRGKIRLDFGMDLNACLGRDLRIVDLDTLEFYGSRITYATLDGEKRYLKLK